MSAKVYIPHPKGGNTFFDEIMAHSVCSFSFGPLEEDVRAYNVVLIHWPEFLFHWRVPTSEELTTLEGHLLRWKQHCKLVYVVHNEQPHGGNHLAFSRLYALVQNHCDVMVHMGQYSLKRYAALYPLAKHCYIPHPLYRESYQRYDTFEARAQLGIPKHKKVLVVPGDIRTKLEKGFILKAFAALSVKDKFLVVPRMFEKQLPFKVWVPYRFRRNVRINDWLIGLYNLHFRRDCKLSYGFQEAHYLSLVLSAADVIFIPRIHCLNSGTLFLGLTYGKPIVGPAIGNLTEVLETFGMPMFDPSKEASVEKALNQAFDMGTLQPDTSVLQAFEPQMVAKAWDDLLYGLL